MISDEVIDAIANALYGGEDPRAIEARFAHVPGARVVLYALNECADVLTTEQMLERIEQRSF